MAIASEHKKIAIDGFAAAHPGVGRGGSIRGIPERGKAGPKHRAKHRAVRPASSEKSPRRLIAHTWILTKRLLRRWSRNRASVLESLIMPVALLVTLNTVLGDAVRQVTGHSALYGLVPLIAMVGAVSGSMVGGISLIGERTDGLLSRLWVLPVHRASGLLSRLVADVIRICGNHRGHHVRRTCARFPLPAGCPGISCVAVRPGFIRGGVHDSRHHGGVVRGEHGRGGDHRDHLGFADVFQQRLCASRPVPELAAASRPESAHEQFRRGDARTFARWSGAGAHGRNAAVVGGHRRRMRDTDGDWIPKGQHAWMKPVVLQANRSRTVMGRDSVLIVGDSKPVA